MYKAASVKKAINEINARRAYYAPLAVDAVKMAISGGNRKIGRVLNVSLPPVVTCGNCSHCALYCYDIKACLQYPGTVIDARVRNLHVLINDRDEYFRRIDEKMTHRRKNKFFRWHVAGDIIDYDYFDRMVKNARNHPEYVAIWTYTKMYNIINKWIDNNGLAAIPANFHVMFSKWDGVEMDNPHNMPVFACKLKDGNADPMPWNDMYKCPGNCDLCKAGRRGCMAGENTYADEH